MNKLLKFVLVGTLLATTVACSKVPAGNVGVKAYLLGTNKGVDVEELGPGRYYIGINEELYLFPTFTQNYTWTQAPDETGDENEELGFQTVEGLAVTADVGISYRIDPDKAATIFQKYRKGVNEITDIYLRNMVRDSLVKNASTIPVESVYGAGKTKLIEAVQADVTKQVADIGIIVEKVYWVGELRLPKAVTESINAKIQMTQEAQRAQNQVAKAEAEARVREANATGAANALVTIATAKADAIRIEGAALAANPTLVELRAVEKWDGKLPTTNAGVVPFIKVQ